MLFTPISREQPTSHQIEGLPCVAPHSIKPNIQNETTYQKTPPLSRPDLFHQHFDGLRKRCDSRGDDTHPSPAASNTSH